MTQPEKSLKIKVCGITDAANMMEVAALQPDYLGFIFYPPSPRDITHKIKDLPLDGLPINIRKIAVMLDQPIEEALKITKEFGFDLVQLHGTESPDYCKALQKHLPVIKAFAVKDSLPENLGEYENCCDFFLFDTKAQKPGGTGLSFDHRLLQEYNGNTHFFLSGGIGPDYPNMENPMNHPLLHALDVNSRFETSPGLKDVTSLAIFIKKIKNK